MAKNMLKRYGRFELLELIYNMRKDNLELKERCEKAEQEAADIRAESERKLEAARRDFESRIEELRMQGAAKDLQIRMKKIEEQLRVMQKLTSIDLDISGMPDEDEVNRLAKDIEQHSETTNDHEKEEAQKDNIADPDG